MPEARGGRPNQHTNKNPAFAGLFYRGARIRTGDLADPNGARYQAAPRPDAGRSIPHRYRPRSMPARLADIVQALDGLLTPERFDDYCPNGLQVPGCELVETVASGVTAQVELFERARGEGAQLVLAHHGLFWGTGPGAIDAALARRLRLLFEADMSLLAYHLPLDAHREVGNNALLARALGGEQLEPFARHRGEPIGCLAELAGEGVPIAELLTRVRDATSREPLAFDYGPPVVKRIGIVTGAAADSFGDAIAAGADAFLTGEPAERVMAQAREASVHFIAAGHYATETFGVRALGELLAERFGVRHVFIDIPNPV
jgi:dinuclear metal center YbgI/SA1388 family protein